VDDGSGDDADNILASPSQDESSSRLLVPGDFWRWRIVLTLGMICFLVSVVMSALVVDVSPTWTREVFPAETLSLGCFLLASVQLFASRSRSPGFSRRDRAGAFVSLALACVAFCLCVARSFAVVFLFHRIRLESVTALLGFTFGQLGACLYAVYSFTLLHVCPRKGGDKRRGRCSTSRILRHLSWMTSILVFVAVAAISLAAFARIGKNFLNTTYPIVIPAMVFFPLSLLGCIAAFVTDLAVDKRRASGAVVLAGTLLVFVSPYSLFTGELPAEPVGIVWLVIVCSLEMLVVVVNWMILAEADAALDDLTGVSEHFRQLRRHRRRAHRCCPS
jgi:hypothetical protein